MNVNKLDSTRCGETRAMKLLRPATTGSLAALLLASACATEPVSRGNERPAARFVPAGEDATGIRFIRPGALVVATFDANHDLEITREEVAAGAAASFSNADTDGNGMLTPIEQRAWASRITSEEDPAANPTLFDPNLDGSVTAEEFVSGMVKFSERFADTDGRIFMTAFTFAPGRAERRGSFEGDDGVERLRPQTNPKPTRY